MPRGERPMPKRVQSELNGRVFDASDFRWALLTLLRDRSLTEAEMAASPAQTQEQEGLAAWARTEEGWVPVGVLEHQEQPQTNHEIALDECRRLACAYFLEHWDERKQAYTALSELPIWSTQPGSPDSEPKRTITVLTQCERLCTIRFAVGGNAPAVSRPLQA
ncbi:uncharacterized protein STAUR_2672 [Stigmatella aurantiaca DW4/3-1]|nr:uncharacterized protein STAUR_2672 [Stigmatella aurantiaca DW4/3-1]